ncbi:MAG: D-alanyl-D-alanine carboxypeptidase family protein [Syntrophomonadaceae bacterium]|nr:D-alanyl-D-alanine carboxypeptidase family protein [Syntrophomonadaceae bacterium]
MEKSLSILIALIITFLFVFPAGAADISPPPVLESEAAVLMDAKTGQILFEKNMNQQLYPASITKIMTILLGLENGNPDDMITMSHQAVYSIERGSAHIALDEGEQITMEQALMAAMLPSANDASNGIAEHIGGSVPEFVKLMNQRAAAAGALNTHFANANGLHDNEHVTTAYDMAMITQEALMNEQFRRIFGTVQFEIPPTNKKTEPRYFWTEHKMMKPGKYEYDGVIGGKTGYTKEAECTLVTAARRGDRELIVVVLKSSTSGVYNDTKALLDYGFDEFVDASVMLPAVTADNFTGSSDGIQVAQELLDQTNGSGYSRLLHKNIDPEDIQIDYTTIVNPDTSDSQLKIDLYLKNPSAYMCSALGSILLDIPRPAAENTIWSTALDVTALMFKIIAVIIIALYGLRFYIKFKRRRRRGYGVIDTAIKRGTRINYSRTKD